MKKEHRVWWEELADWYEELADDRDSLQRDYTCCLLEESGQFGFISSRGYRYTPPDNVLRQVWRQVYANNGFPVGKLADRREDEESRWACFDGGAGNVTIAENFCLVMAELIREGLDNA